MSCRLILNADDLGWSEGVNAAVCALYDAGIVSSASLMVTAPAAADAVRRLRERPGLAVGLHVALVRAPALLPPGQVPRLAPRGRLSEACIGAGLRCTFWPAYRAEARREVEAQFRKFDALRLGWSHVDTHVHFALTPAVSRLVLAQCRLYPVLGLRVPLDDYRLHLRLEPRDAARQALLAAHFALCCRLQRPALRGSGLLVPARCYGLFRTGRLDAAYLARLVRALPDGDLELHCHPDLSTAAGRAEYEALRSSEFRNALVERGVILSTYASAVAAASGG